MITTIVPTKKVRKARIQETNKYLVKWHEGDYIFMRWFKRDRFAIQFQQELIDDGIPMRDIRILMK